MEATSSDAARIANWIERNIGGRIIRFERQPRWRPMYFVDIERNGETLALCARCARADMPMLFPLHHEMLLQRTLDEHGIPVPKVLGWCDEPECYVMERVPGVAHLEGVDSGARDGVMREYGRLLAKVHALPTESFKRAGVVHADRPEDAHLVAQRRFRRPSSWWNCPASQATTVSRAGGAIGWRCSQPRANSRKASGRFR